MVCCGFWGFGDFGFWGGLCSLVLGLEIWFVALVCSCDGAFGLLV